jgi:ABC-2 type transport system permease protein
MRTFREIFWFELRQQLKSPLFWMIALAFAALAVGVASSDDIQMGGAVGNTHRNAPSVITEWLSLFTVLGMFLITVFVAGAALRDFEAGTAELFFATPMSRSAYLGGRFAAGYIASVVIMIAVAAGLLMGLHMPSVDASRLGPTSLGTYAYAFGVFVLPGLFFMSAFLFLFATLTRSMLTTYLGVLAFFLLRGIAQATASNFDYNALGAMIDPFGLAAFRLATRYWSAEDRNTRLPEVVGVLLANRALWIAISTAMIASTLALFRPEREGLRLGRRKRQFEAAAPRAQASDTTALPQVTLRRSASARWQQFLKLASFDTRGVLSGVAFLVMLAFGLMNLGVSLGLSNRYFDTKLYPVTHVMNETMNGSFKWLLYLIIAFYAGELVWRERSARISEVTDAFPMPDWIPLLSKLIAIASVIVIFQLAGCVECSIYQLLRGYHHIEPGLYLSNLAMSSLQFLLIAVLALFLQVLANNKFLGYLLIVIFFVSGIALEALHFDHNLYNFGSSPAVPYSDMNGYGHFLTAWSWFSAYWTCLAIAMIVVAALYWPRGTVQGWTDRMRVAGQRFSTPSRAVLAASLLAFVGSGGWIFYNTNVINRYVPGDMAMKQQADYEKRYRRYLDLPQPKITDVKADVDIYPHERKIDVRGHYRIANKTDKPITDLHVLIPVYMKLVSLQFAPHDVVSTDPVNGYTIYRLKQPMAPGATMDFAFDVQFWSRGFRNSPNDTHVVDNGTFFNNQAFPHFGYNDEGELTDRNDRRKYGLGEPHRMPKIGDGPAHQFNLLERDSDWVNFETTVSTVPDQIAIAPGYLEKEWTANGRRYFHYKMDKPILDFFSFQSARYAVKRDSYNGVAIEVYYDPQHPYNVDRMIEAAKKSMAHYDAVYAPYQFRQFRILEFPMYERFAQSFANTVPFSESIGFIADLRDPADIDYVFYVTAHELAHQWWAHQVIGANVQGVTMLDETFAQYSALMVQEKEYGPAKMHKFLKFELDRYLTGRGDERVEELPLALNENQNYIHYRKGSVVMYSLKDYLGEDVIDRALAHFDRDYAFKGPPYADTRDFLAGLRQEAGPQWNPLITDLFEKITIFDNRVIEVTSKKRADGKYDVTLKIHAAKIYVDGVGKETPAKINIPIDIGVFAKAADGRDQDEEVLYLSKRTVANGDSKVTITVDSEPYEAGIDPYNKLVDRVSDDNRMRVTLQ